MYIYERNLVSVLHLKTCMIDFKGHRFEQDIILTGVRWYLAYPLIYRNLEEMLAERGVEVEVVLR